MASAKNAPVRPVVTLADATAKTRSLIESLQARLAPEGDNGAATLAVPIRAPRTEKTVQLEETEEDLEKQLQMYFERDAVPARGVSAVNSTARAQTLDEIRAGVVDGVVERILAEWSQPQREGSEGAELKREVVARLVDRVIDQLHKTRAAQKV